LVTLGTGESRRSGEVLEVVAETGQRSTLRVRWDDGRESRIDPEEQKISYRRSALLPSRPGRHDSRNVILKHLPRHTAGAEVGVWKGDFAMQMLRIVRPRSLYLVDPWEFMPDPHHAHTRYGGSIARSAADMDNVYKFVKARFRKDITRGRVSICRGDLAQLLRQLPLALDWIYIDGDHNYPAVASDLANAVRLVRPGGYILGDDYIEDGWWGDAVIRAVGEVIEQGHAKLRLVEKSQYLLERQ
jgi:hypothetical protein